MLRASSDMAVAISVASPLEKPSSVSRARPLCRAATISWSELMPTRFSPALTVSLSVYVLEYINQVSQSLLQIQCRCHVLPCPPHLHPRNGYIRQTHHR